MDQDGDNELTLDEFENAFATEEVIRKLRLLDFGPADCRELFYLLDTGDGALSLDEFFSGLTRMEGSASAKDVFRIMKTVESTERLIKQLSIETAEDLRDIARVLGCKLNKRSRTLRQRSNLEGPNAIRTMSQPMGKFNTIQTQDEKFSTDVLAPVDGYTSPNWSRLESPYPNGVRDIRATPQMKADEGSLMLVRPDDSKLMLQRLDEICKKVDSCNDKADQHERAINSLASDVAGAKVRLERPPPQVAPPTSIPRNQSFPAMCSFASRAPPEEHLRWPSAPTPALTPGPAVE